MTTAATTPAPSDAGPGTPAPSAAPAAAAPPTSSTLLSAEPAKTADPAAPASEPAKAAPVGAPEKYSDFTIPEGMTVDAKAVEAFTPVMRELNLTQDAAQKLVDIYAAQVQQQAVEFGKQLQDPEFATQQAGVMLAHHRDAWAAAVKADKDIGGANFDASVQTAQRALARFGSPELKGLLEMTGLGNHPAVVRAFVQIGKQIREDSPSYGTSGDGRKSNVEVFYPSATSAGA